MSKRTQKKRQAPIGFAEPGSLNRDFSEPLLPKLIMPVDILGDILSYCSESPGEIRGYGFISHEREGNRDIFRVKNLIIPKQTVTGCSVNVSADAMIDMMIVADAQGLSMNDLRFVWHSHVDFSPFWSGVDIGDINSTGQGLVESPYVINMVINRMAEYLCRIDQFTPLRFHSEIEVEFVPADSQVDRFKQDISSLVTLDQVVYGTAYSPLIKSGYNPYLLGGGVCLNDDDQL